MSCTDSILGIEGLEVQRVDRGPIIHVWAKPKRRLDCIYCLQSPVRIKATHDRTLKHTRQGNQLMVLHLLLVKHVRAKHAKKKLIKLTRLISQFAQSPAKTLAERLQSWLEPIVRMWRFSKSNGITEGFHTKMEMIF